MSIPIDIAHETAMRLLSGRGRNIAAQNYARQILLEVEEIGSNYPNFDLHLTEKATHLAYTLIACGCSIVEDRMLKSVRDDAEEGMQFLEKAGKLLSDVFRHNRLEPNRDYNLLISGMCLFAAKQYSRAFITLKDVNPEFA